MKLKFIPAVFTFLLCVFGIQKQDVHAFEPEFSQRNIICDMNFKRMSLDNMYGTSTSLWNVINQIILSMIDDCVRRDDRAFAENLHTFLKQMCVWRASKTPLVVECKDFFDIIDYARLHFINDYLPKVTASQKFSKRMTFSEYESFLVKNDIKAAQSYSRVAYISDKFLKNFFGGRNFKNHKENIETIQEMMATLNYLKVKIQEKLAENVYEKYKKEEISFSSAALSLQKELAETRIYKELALALENKNKYIKILHSISISGPQAASGLDFEDIL